MPRTLLFALILGLATPTGSLAHRHRPGEVVGSFAQAWSQHSAAELADLFAENGTLTHPFAVASQSLVSGRSAIESSLKGLFSGDLVKSTYAVKAGTVRERQVGPLWVLEFEATITGVEKLRGPLDHRATMVLEPSKGAAKEPGGEAHEQHWSIATLTLAVPAPEFAPRNVAVR